MINKRYKILKKLGEGGSGEVYLVNDTYTGKNVSMKILHVGRVADVHGIRREFDMLKNFNHPNLITVFEFDTVQSSGSYPAFQNRHYYTMEHCSGSNALHFFSALPNGPQKTVMLEETFIQMLMALEIVHRQGIIHYDIKPQNIFVLEDAGVDNADSFAVIAKLMDFGFSSNAVPGIEDNPSRVRGTIEYIAPELLQGQPADIRIDLYSLGATFYHLWSGKCPYQGETAIAALKSILESNALPLQDWAGNSSRLPTVVSKLLSKKPNERYASAWEVLREFAGSDHEDAIKRSLIAVSASSFVGRKSELQVVDNEISNLITDVQCKKYITFAGPSGSGKTRLLEQIERRTPGNDCLIIRLQPEVDRIIEAAKSMSRFPLLKRDCKSIVVLLDDVNRMNAEDRQELNHWCDTLKSEQNMLLVSTNSEDVDHPDASLGINTIVNMVLGELTIGEVQELFSIAGGNEVFSTDFIERFYDSYGGSPHLVQAAIRMLVNAIPLDLLRDKESFDDMSDTLEELLASRLTDILLQGRSQLRPEKQLLLQSLACFQIPVRPDVLAGMVPFRRARLEEFLCSLARSGYVCVNGPTHYSLRQKSLKNHLYSSLKPQEQVHLHEMIALRWIDLPGERSWEEEAELGRHFELAEKFEDAGNVYERSGDRAMVNEKYLYGAQLYSKACHVAGDKRTVSLRMKQARAYTLAGADARCVELWNSLLEEGIVNDLQRIEISKEVGKAFVRLGENSKATRMFENILTAPLNNLDRFEMQQELIALKTAAGFFDDALTLGITQRGIASEFSDSQKLALVENDMGIAYFYKGELQKSLESFNHAYQLYSGAKNTEKIIASLNNMGNVLSAMGKTRSALESWNEALNASQDPSKKHERGLLFNNIGIAHFKLGEFSEARNSYEQAKQVFIELRQKSETAHAMTNLGEVEFAEGNYERALRSWQDALQLYREMQDAVGIGQALLALANMHLLIGQETKAQRLLNEANQIIEEFTLPSLEPFHHFLEGECALAMGQYEQAERRYKSSEQGFRSVGDAFTGGIETPVHKIQQIQVRKTELLISCGRMDGALRLLRENEGSASTYPPLLRAEREFIFGLIARASHDQSLQSPLTYFKRALGNLENEHISELSWRISFELACEYRNRGNSDKSREFFGATIAVLDYLASKFTDEPLRMKYLETHDRMNRSHIAKKGLSTVPEGA